MLWYGNLKRVEIGYVVIVQDLDVNIELNYGMLWILTLQNYVRKETDHTNRLIFKTKNTPKKSEKNETICMKQDF